MWPVSPGEPTGPYSGVMRLSSTFLIASGVLVASLVGCGNEEPICGGAALVDALATAAAGTTVSLSSCAAATSGALRVPEGVTLRGTGRESTEIDVGTGSLELAPGATLAGLAVRGGGDAAILVIGGGTPVAIEDVQVEVTRGVALRVEQADGVVLRNVELSGPVTADNATTVPPMPSATETATHGLLLIDVGEAAQPALLDGVSMHGFARFGALFIDSVVSWTGGGATDNLSVGVMVHGGSLDIEDAQICRTLEGVQPLPAYAAVFDEGARVSSDALEICDNEGYGILQDSAGASHVDLVAANNGEPAVWVQFSDGLALSGSETRITDNELAGLVVVESSDVVVRDAVISGTRLATRIMGTLEVRVGDGIHALLADSDTLLIEDVSLIDNRRSGALLQVESGVIRDGALSRVSVSGSDDAFGVVAQTATTTIPRGGWDVGVVRGPVTDANDDLFTDRLAVVGIINPMFLPPVTDR